MVRVWSRLAALLVVLAAVGLSTATSSSARQGECTVVTLSAASADCSWSYSDYRGEKSSGDGSTWVVRLQCDNGGICVDRVECLEGGVAGFMSDVFRDGIDVGDVCVPEAEVEEVDYVRLAVREFKSLEWPASAVSVDPPDGRTLVNFDTFFYTANARPTIKVVTLAGRQVSIRATPVSYAWSFGDGEGATTASAGAGYPGGDIVHVYVERDDFEVNVDTTYSGQFKVDDGEWQPIEPQVTVVGPGVELSTIEARPELVDDPLS